MQRELHLPQTLYFCYWYAMHTLDSLLREQSPRLDERKDLSWRFSQTSSSPLESVMVSHGGIL